MTLEYSSQNALSFKRSGDVGLDLRATEDITIKPGQSALIKTETLVKLPQGYGAFVVGRSGLTRKTKLRVNIGTIDTNYRGEIGIMAENTSKESNIVDKVKAILNRDKLNDRDIVINKGDRVAQLVPFKAYDGDFSRRNREYIEGDETERGTNGYGSSGIN